MAKQEQKDYLRAQRGKIARKAARTLWGESDKPGPYWFYLGLGKGPGIGPPGGISCIGGLFIN